MGFLVGNLIFGIAVALLAHHKGRNPIGWFFIGALLTLIGLVLVLVVPNLNQEKYWQTRRDEENRRLREQLRQERGKHETLREYTMKRLDVHDQVLGVDTRSLQAALPVENGSAMLPYAQP